MRQGVALLKKTGWLLGCLFALAACRNEPHFQTRGVVLSVEDLASVNWPELAFRNGINTIGTHVHPDQVARFLQSNPGKTFLADCRKYGIAVEHQLHAMNELLPRELFEEDSLLFRMDETGKRNPDYNCCVSSPRALEIIAHNAAAYARLLPATNHRYYFWLDDEAPVCRCAACAGYSASEQALLVENRMIEALRETDPEALLAHLAYGPTLEAPRRVRPADGVFLEFAPIYRTWDRPLSDTAACGRTGESHAACLRALEANLSVFPAESAVVLEYWLDISLFSRWKKPACRLPWEPGVFRSDAAIYARYGIRHITSFAVFLDSSYMDAYPDISFLREYGDFLNRYRD